MPGLELKAPSPKAQSLTYNATLYFLVNAQSGKHLLRSCFVPSTLPGLRGQILPQDAERGPGSIGVALASPVLASGLRTRHPHSRPGNSPVASPGPWAAHALGLSLLTPDPTS